ncbi:unnamed protein product [Victoria cruziana]
MSPDSSSVGRKSRGEPAVGVAGKTNRWTTFGFGSSFARHRDTACRLLSLEPVGSVGKELTDCNSHSRPPGGPPRSPEGHLGFVRLSAAHTNSHRRAASSPLLIEFGRTSPKKKAMHGTLSIARRLEGERLIGGGAQERLP